MKRCSCFLLAGALVCVGTAWAGSPKTEVADAARKLAEEPGYSWISTPKMPREGGFRQGPTEGKTERDGPTHIVVSFNENVLEAAYQGDRSVIKWEGAWRAPDELSGNRSRLARRYTTLRAPAQEAEDLVLFSKGLKKISDDTYTGELTADGVKHVLAQGGRDDIEVKNAKGSVTFWLKQGALDRYEFVTQGTMIYGQGDRVIEIDRTTTVIIQNVGRIKVSLPEDASKKLS